LRCLVNRVIAVEWSAFALTSFGKALRGGKSEHLFSTILRGAKNSSG